MKKLKLYIETSVWNFILADDAPEKKRDTLLFFDNVLNNNDYELYISTLVMEEINNAPDPIRTQLAATISVHDPEELDITDEMINLADKYADAKLVPEKAYRDLLYVAAATVENMDFIISWNLSHIVRAKTIVGVHAVNLMEGYGIVRIGTVLEVLR